MGKTKDAKKSSDGPKKAKPSPVSKKATKGGGLDEIDSLFAKKKQSDREMQEQAREEKEAAREERRRRKRARLEEEADEIALRGTSSSAAAASSSSAGAKKGDAVAPAALHDRAEKLSSLTYTRSDVEQLNGAGSKKEAKDKWASDGLGGVFNGEGYTGRKDDGGHRVFKAHLMNRPGFGESPDCPFDCDCCFI